MRFNRPTVVRTALVFIEKSHPYAASGRIARSDRADRDSNAVWERLLPLAGDALRAAVRSLTKHEERLILYRAGGRLGDPPCLEVLAVIFELRSPAGGGRVAWEAFLRTNGRTAFATAARDYAAKPGQPSGWSELANGSSPVERACDLYSRGQSRLAQWVSSAEIRLPETGQFVRNLKRNLLVPRRLPHTLRRESTTVLDTWLDEVFLDSERVAWFRAYLSVTDKRLWQLDDPVLVRILRRFESPSRKRPFWDKVPPDVVKAFELWERNVELTRLLGEGPRVEFWRAFLPMITESFQPACQDAVFICFHNWFAVQFIEMGRATYMFERRYLSAFRKLNSNSLYRAVRENVCVGRYTHMGWYWQVTAESEVKKVIRNQNSR